MMTTIQPSVFYDFFMVLALLSQIFMSDFALKTDKET